MSALLLDTHIWLWYAEGNTRRLPPQSVKKLDQFRQAEGLRVSSISVWEIGVLHAKGKVQLSAPLRDWVRAASAPTGISLLALDAEAAAESTLLPGQLHADPADRFMIATARTRGLILATRDESIVEYGNAGHVRILEL
jgi:PIN domain nuclease of toxin-antitoxin system